jgi:hypothetical protein
MNTLTIRDSDVRRHVAGADSDVADQRSDPMAIGIVGIILLNRLHEARRASRAFRIADMRHAISDGTGPMLYGARWNSPGRRVIYAAVTYAGA